MNLNKFDVKLLGDWIQGKHALESWADRLNVAKALRNCSVHGALSADKAHKLGFVSALNQLTEDLEDPGFAAFDEILQQYLLHIPWPDAVQIQYAVDRNLHRTVEWVFVLPAYSD